MLHFLTFEHDFRNNHKLSTEVPCPIDYEMQEREREKNKEDDKRIMASVKGDIFGAKPGWVH